ncbi:MAG: histidine phosphatase family protein [Nanoarchaeota archaeon]
MKFHIYLFRHGQTTFNRDKRFTGWLDAKLTPLGIKQAKKVASKLKNKQIDIAVQTTLSRSKDTLNYVLKYHPECRKVMTDNRMIERSYGNFEGKYHKDIIAKYGKEKFDKWHRDYDFPPPKGESIKMVERRVKEFIKDTLIFMKKYKMNVAISAHGNSMRPFRRYFEKLSVKEMMKLENPYDDYFEYTINVK